MICTPRTAGTCAPQRGRPTATSARPESVGSAPARSPTRYPPTTPTGQPCASPRAPCCAGSPGESMQHVAGAASTNCGSCAPPPGTRRHWPSAWPGWWRSRVSRRASREASQLASEQHGPARVDRRSDLDGGAVRSRRSTPSLRPLSSVTCCGGHRRVIDLADGDPAKGNFIIGSPLAIAWQTRAIARYCLGRPGWRDDLRRGLAMARSADPASHAAGRHLRSTVRGNTGGVLLADDPWCARSRMPYGLPNDPVTISRGRRPDDAGSCAGAPRHGCRA